MRGTAWGWRDNAGDGDSCGDGEWCQPAFAASRTEACRERTSPANRRVKTTYNVNYDSSIVTYK